MSMSFQPILMGRKSSRIINAANNISIGYLYFFKKERVSLPLTARRCQHQMLSAADFNRLPLPRIKQSLLHFFCYNTLIIRILSIIISIIIVFIIIAKIIKQFLFGKKKENLPLCLPPQRTNESSPSQPSKGTVCIPTVCMPPPPKKKLAHRASLSIVTVHQTLPPPCPIVPLAVVPCGSFTVAPIVLADFVGE